MTPVVSINLVVRNGEKDIRHCLDAILAQKYPHEHIGSIFWITTRAIRQKRDNKKTAQEFQNAGFAKFNLAETMRIWACGPARKSC